MDGIPPSVLDELTEIVFPQSNIKTAVPLKEDLLVLRLELVLSDSTPLHVVLRRHHPNQDPLFSLHNEFLVLEHLRSSEIPSPIPYHYFSSPSGPFVVLEYLEGSATKVLNVEMIQDSVSHLKSIHRFLREFPFDCSFLPNQTNFWSFKLQFP